MNSIILRTGTMFLLPLLLLASVVITLRGHNEPGGGFVGGLTAATAFVLFMLAFGPRRCRKILPVPAEAIAAVGFGVALLSGVLPVGMGRPLFMALWTDYEPIPGVKIGTPLLFDVGVYLTVMGTVLMMVLAIAEWKSSASPEHGTDDSRGAHPKEDV